MSALSRYIGWNNNLNFYDTNQGSIRHQRVKALREQIDHSGIEYRVGLVTTSPYSLAFNNESFVLSLVAPKGQNSLELLKERLTQLRTLLINFLLPTEHLDVRDRGYWIVGDGYSITITVECFNKMPWMVAWESDGKVHTEFLGRISSFGALRQLKRKNKIGEVLDLVCRYMSSLDYANPSDRLVHAVMNASRETCREKRRQALKWK